MRASVKQCVHCTECWQSLSLPPPTCLPKKPTKKNTRTTFSYPYVSKKLELVFESCYLWIEEAAPLSPLPKKRHPGYAVVHFFRSFVPPWDFLHYDPAAYQDHCVRCRTPTWDLCPSHQWATTSQVVEYIMFWCVCAGGQGCVHLPHLGRQPWAWPQEEVRHQGQ